MKYKKLSPIVIMLFLWMQLFIPFQSVFAQNEEEYKPAVAVADMDASGITVQEAMVLSNRLRAEVWKTQKFDILERQAMDDILTEQGFQLSGACDQASCLLEIGKLLPVEKIIGGSVGKVGTTWTITLRMIDIASGRIERTVTRDCPKCTIDEILSPLLGYAAKDMAGLEVEYAELHLGEDSMVRKQTDGSSQTEKLNAGMDMAASKDGGSIFGKWWFWGIILAGAGGGVAAAMGSSPADESGGGSDGHGSIDIRWK